MMTTTNAPASGAGSLAAQRKHDEELAASMRVMARWVQKRSAKTAMLLAAGADRIDDLAAKLAQLDPQPQPAPQPELQPASTPAPH